MMAKGGSAPMQLDLRRELKAVPDLRHRVRHLRWFKSSFRRDAELVASQHGVALHVDERKLTAAFLSWIEAFNRQKSYAALDRRDFSLFAAGLLLREFMKARPGSVRGGARPPDLDAKDSIVDFWPEGFLYTSYCVSVLAAVMEQEFGETLNLVAAAGDLRSWWSYRENVSENPSLAIAFLDRFVGEEPNWRLPDAPEGRAAMRRATQRLLAHDPGR
jgi:hypothetical protein